MAVFSRPDIVLVDEVLAVGDASFRRRALEALRQIIADGRTVLFISHDMWNVRRLCDRILWLEEGRVRAYGPAGEIAERYMNEVNLAGAGESGCLAAEPSGRNWRAALHRRRYHGESGVPATSLVQGETLVVAASYRAERPVERPVFQVTIIDVDTGLVITTATSSRADAPDSVSDGGTIECRFAHLPLRPRQYALRLSITDSSSARVVRCRERRAPFCHRRPRIGRGQPR